MVTISISQACLTSLVMEETQRSHRLSKGMRLVVEVHFRAPWSLQAAVSAMTKEWLVLWGTIHFIMASLVGIKMWPPPKQAGQKHSLPHQIKSNT